MPGKRADPPVSAKRLTTFMIGPKITIHATCFDCVHCTTESYRCQSDSGQDVYCNAVGAKKHIADSRWDTPAWCPFLADAKKAVCAEAVNQHSCRDSR